MCAAVIVGVLLKAVWPLRAAIKISKQCPDASRARTYLSLYTLRLSASLENRQNHAGQNQQARLSSSHFFPVSRIFGILQVVHEEDSECQFSEESLQLGQRVERRRTLQTRRRRIEESIRERFRQAQNGETSSCSHEARKSYPAPLPFVL